MEKILRLKTYVDGGVNDTPFPSSDNQIEIGEFRYDAKRMGGAPTITATVMYETCLDEVWTDTVYAEFNGEKYYLKQTPTSSYSNEDERYKHNLELVSERVILDNVYFYDAVVDEALGDDKPVSNSTKVVFFGSVHEFANRLNHSLAQSGIDYTVEVDDDIETEEKLISFEDQFFSNVLQEIYNTYDVPYYFDGKVIRIGYTNNVIPNTFAYGVDDALLSITKNNANYKVVNRVTGTGSTDNIPFYYPNNSPKGEIEATSSNEKLAVTILDTELYSNEVEIDGVVTRSNIDYENLEVTHLGESIYSGETFSAQMGYGGINKNFTVTFDAKDVGELSVSFESEVTKYILNDAEINDATFGVRYNLSLRTPSEDGYPYGRTVFTSGSLDAIEDVRVPVVKALDGYKLTIEVNYAATGKYAGKGGNIAYNASFDFGSDSGWTYNGEPIELKDVGLKVEGDAVVGDTITQKLVKYIKTSQTLMPSIYRETDGAERFYNAVGDEYPNPYTEGHPKEHIITVEDIKPTIKEATNDVSWVETDEDGNQVTVFQRMDMFSEFAYDLDDNDELVQEEDGEEHEYVHSYFFAKLRKLDFNLFDHAIEGQPMTISFTSGPCGACNFEIGVTEEFPQLNPVQVNADGTLKRDELGRVICGQFEEISEDECQPEQQDTINNEVWIALKKEEETYGILMPKAPTGKDEEGNDIGEHRPKGCTWDEEKQVYLNDGDTFVILGINLPREYILNAEKKLEAEIIKYMKENNEEKFNFSIAFSRIYFEENPDVLQYLNENSRLTITYNGLPYTLYVNSFSYSMSEGDVLPQITVELDEALTISQNALQNAINEVKSEVGKALDVLSLSTPYFLRKDADDEARGRINFTKGVKFGEGGKVEVLDNNSAKLTIEYLEVTKKASFTSLEIQEKTHVGGQMLITPAAINCGEVEEFDDYYRCYFQTKGEDGDEIFNQFAVGDQAICQTYNAWGSKYYWRLVVGIGEDYIDLSKTECDEDSGIPSAGDKIIQLGNQVDEARQNAIVIAAYGDGSPYIIQYKGINAFEIPDDKIVTKLSSTENIFTGKVHMELGSDGLSALEGWTEAEAAIKKAQDTADEALEKAGDYSALTEYVDQVKEDLQSQIDGAIDSYFYEYEPTTSNYPASEWDTNEEKSAHLNDTFTNLTDGRSWRWSLSNGTYSWVEITDTATSQALALAGQAQETADGKMTVFMNQPKPPYKAGDLWAGGEDAPLRRCITTRESGSYNESDWALADNAQSYADAIKAELEQSVSNTKAELETSINSAKAESKDYTDEAKTAIDNRIAEVENAKANLSDVYDKATVDGKVNQAEADAISAAQGYANAQNDYLNESLRAWADGEIDAAEQRALEDAQAKVDAAKKEMEKYTDKAIDDMEIGGANLLRNSGFTGDYLSEQLADDSVLDAAAELYSAPFDHWDYDQGVSRIELSDIAQSGYGVSFASGGGTLRQNLAYKILAQESYTLSFSAKGTSVDYLIGEATGTLSLSENWDRYEVTVTPTSTGDGFSLESTSSTFYDIKLEKGNKSTSWNPSQLDNASDRAYYQSMKYLSSAIADGSTDILGGLVLTNTLLLGNADDDVLVENTAGVNGVITDAVDDVAFWAGGTLEQANETIISYLEDPTYQPTEEELASMANFVVTHGGRAILNDIILRGYIYALGGKIGNLEVKDCGIYAKTTSGGNFSISDVGVTFLQSDGSYVNIGTGCQEAIKITGKDAGGKCYLDEDLYKIAAQINAADGYHAIHCLSGVYAGLRPNIRKVTSSTNLDELDHTIIISATNEITLTLPYAGTGQVYKLINTSGKTVNLALSSSYQAIVDIASSESVESFNKLGVVTLTYFDSLWYAEL